MNHKAIACTNCNLWSHMKCNDVDQKQYVFYENNPPHGRYFTLLFTRLGDYQFDNMISNGIMESYNLNFKPSLHCF